LIDPGIFVSAADRDEPRHTDCAAVLRSRPELVVPAPVIPEAAWLIESRLGPSAEAKFLTLVTSSRFRIIDLELPDCQRTVALVTAYADLGLGFVDASIVAVAERLNVNTIATLNRRDFAVVRPTHVTALDLVP
jgi:uncharacterized protein